MDTFYSASVSETRCLSGSRGWRVRLSCRFGARSGIKTSIIWMEEEKQKVPRTVQLFLRSYKWRLSGVWPRCSMHDLAGKLPHRPAHRFHGLLGSYLFHFHRDDFRWRFEQSLNPTPAYKCPAVRVMTHLGHRSL